MRSPKDSPSLRSCYSPNSHRLDDVHCDYLLHSPGMLESSSKGSTSRDEDEEQFATGRIASWWRRRTTLRVWWWETVCCLFFVASLLATIITVRLYEHKPLPDWPYGVSINTILAIFTVIMKASAGLTLAQGISHLKWRSLSQPTSLQSFQYHDDASRGPWGSVKLLWHSKGSSISSLGALVTILVLFLDPFSQQIIQFYTCTQQSNDRIATIPRSQFYVEKETYDVDDAGSKPGDYTNWDAKLGMRKAISNAIYGVDAPRVPFTCPTGNCTITKEYSSLSFCSKCEDQTRKLIIRRWEDDVGDTYPYQMVNITLPIAMSQGEIMDEYDLKYNAKLSMERFEKETTQDLFAVKTNRDAFFTAMIRYLEKTDSFAAYTCSIYPCVKTYDGRVENGVLKEEVMHEAHEAFDLERPNNVGSDRWAYSTADLRCLSSDQRSRLKEKGYKWKEEDFFVPYRESVVGGTKEEPLFIADNPNCEERTPNGKNVTRNDPLSPCTTSDPNNLESRSAASPIPASCIYTIRHDAQEIIWKSFLWTKFNGTLDSLGTVEQDYLLALYLAGSGNGTLSDATSFFANISNSLTTYVRQHGYKPLEESVSGEVWSETTCVRVRWVWVGYGAIMALLLLVFLAGVVIGTRAREGRLHHDFKSSALTLLYHGFERESLEAKAGKTTREQELYDQVKKETVQLVDTEHGLKLRTVERKDKKLNVRYTPIKHQL